MATTQEQNELFKKIEDLIFKEASNFSLSELIGVIEQYKIGIYLVVQKNSKKAENFENRDKKE